MPFKLGFCQVNGTIFITWKEDNPMKKILLTTAISLSVLSFAHAGDGFELNIAPSFGFSSQKLTNGNIERLVFGGVDAGMAYNISNVVFGVGVNALFGPGPSEAISDDSDDTVQNIAVYGKLAYKIKASRRFYMTPSFLAGVGFNTDTLTAKQDFELGAVDLPKDGKLVTKFTSPVLGAGFEFSYEISDNFNFGLDNKFLAYISPDKGEHRYYDAKGSEITVESASGELPSILRHDVFVYSMNFKMAYIF